VTQWTDQVCWTFGGFGVFEELDGFVKGGKIEVEFDPTRDLDLETRLEMVDGDVTFPISTEVTDANDGIEWGVGLKIVRVPVTLGRIQMVAIAGLGFLSQFEIGSNEIHFLIGEWNEMFGVSINHDDFLLGGEALG
jgi:hypothetical protein